MNVCKPRCGCSPPGALAQSEEHSATDREVGGSRPSRPIHRSTQTGKATVVRWQRLRVRIPSPVLGFASDRGALAQRKSAWLRTKRSEVRVLHVPNHSRGVRSGEEQSASNRPNGGSSPPHSAHSLRSFATGFERGTVAGTSPVVAKPRRGPLSPCPTLTGRWLSTSRALAQGKSLRFRTER